MNGLEETIGQVLKDPQLMEKLMTMAQSLGAAQTEATQASSPAPSAPEPGLIQALAGAAANSGVDPEQRALLRALEPYVSRERTRKLERAMEAARMATFASAFLTGR